MEHSAYKTVKIDRLIDCSWIDGQMIYGEINRWIDEQWIDKRMDGWMGNK